MARPKSATTKVRINLTVSADVKEMTDVIRQHKDISISELLEETIRKEYKKLQKSIKNLPEPQIPGQTSLDEFEDLGSILDSIDFEV